jgi:hypothetical protein
MRPTISLRLEHLEDRAVPATFGNPWPDGSNITLSIVPDGTDIHGSGSNLAQLLSGPNGDAAKESILRAFQTWVANASINIGLVADDGSAFNAAGEVQHDPRFGDIRIGGRNWASDVLALTTTFNYFNTESGNVALNTAAGVVDTHDLQTVMLQESGHTLGVGNSPDINSVMYEYYQGVRTGLSAGDVGSIQALYGARHADAFEGLTGNNTFATATAYAGPLVADLTTAADEDYYSFTIDPAASSTVVHLQASGLSLVQAKVQVFNGNGDLVGEGSALSSTQNDVTLNLENLQGDGTYYVRVSSNRADVFGIGSYRLSVDGTTAGEVSTTAVASQNVAGAFGSFDTAAVLSQTVAEMDQRLDYAVQVSPDAGSNVNFFRVHAPTNSAGQTVHLIASVAGLGSLQNMQLAVYDANQNLLNAKVLTDSAGSTVVQVDNVQSDADYFIKVSAGTGFNLTVDFTSRDIPFTLGSIGNAATMQSATLNVAQSQVLYYVLSADAASDVAVVMTIRDMNGQVVSSLTAFGGSHRSTSVFLKAGYYRVEITALLPIGVFSVTNLAYHLDACGITDPIGAPIADPTTTPVGGTPPVVGSVPPPASNGSTIYFTAGTPGSGSLWF